MANPGQPRIGPGATGPAVRWLQRALRRTPDLAIVVDGVFGPATEHAVTEFQKAGNLAVDGVVGSYTWAALPDGAPMPVLQEGARGAVVAHLQTVLRKGAPGQWGLSPGPTDADFGPYTRSAVEAFQRWARIGSDGIVGDRTWTAALPAAGPTLESAVGLRYLEH